MALQDKVKKKLVLTNRGHFVYMGRFWQSDVNYQVFVTDSCLSGRFVTVSSLKHTLSLMSIFNKAVILNFNKLLPDFPEL
jgi:hypothetical protein